MIREEQSRPTPFPRRRWRCQHRRGPRCCEYEDGPQVARSARQKDQRPTQADIDEGAGDLKKPWLPRKAEHQALQNAPNIAVDQHDSVG